MGDILGNFKTKNQQLKLLREKNILTPPGSGQILLETNYNELIKKYGKIFIDPVKTAAQTKYKKIYKDGVSVIDIYHLLCLDRKLANILIEKILKIEEKIKSVFVYYVCELKGEFALYNKDCYNPAQEEKIIIMNINYLFTTVLRNVDRDFIKKDFVKYGQIPLYVLSEFITLGELYKYLNSIDPIITIKVAKHFDLTTSQLKSYVNLLSKFRNACAHNDVVYSYAYSKAAISPTSVHNRHGLSPNANAIYNYNLFACLAVIKEFMKKKEYDIFIREIDSLIISYTNKCTVLSTNDILNYCGIPLNYKQLLTA